jgi:Na+-driven multidrug efflux pump
VIPRLITPDTAVYNVVFLTVIFAIITLPITNYVFVFDGILQGFRKYNFLMLASVIPMFIVCAIMYIVMLLPLPHLVEFIIQYLMFDFAFVGIRGIFTFFKMRKITAQLQED